MARPPAGPGIGRCSALSRSTWTALRAPAATGQLTDSGNTKTSSIQNCPRFQGIPDHVTVHGL